MGIPDDPWEIVIKDGRVYVADRYGGVRVIDASNPAAPVELGAFDNRRSVNGVAVADGLVYAIDSVNLQVIDFGPEYAVAGGPETEVQIDIKPHSDTNPINLSSNGNVAVALLSSDSFDVRDVDVTTLAFGPAGAAPRHDLTDSKIFEEHLVSSHGSPLKSLISHYATPETGIAIGDTNACLSGEMLAGALFEGCDSILTTTPGRGRRQR
ncbi:MAG: hypothetical protein JRF15_16275 [Deltaproteobacteria bacterium]|nr:hypothetical protein [Deltaproteobacteria bacterium]